MDLKKIGKYIAEKRKEIGMTQRQLAENLGMSDKSVSKWERGVCLPDVSIYIELCQILRISINEFLAGEDIELENMVRKSEENIISVATDNKQKQKHLKAIISALLVVLLAVVVAVPLYGKYSSSKYNDESQDAWIKASTSVIELLDWCCAVEKNGYVVNEGTYWQLNFLIDEGLENISIFQTKTKPGETVNALAEDAQKCIHDTLGVLELDVERKLLNDNKSYVCSEAEKELIKLVVLNLPQIHDSINIEMEVNSPGIVHLYRP